MRQPGEDRNVLDVKWTEHVERSQGSGERLYMGVVEEGNEDVKMLELLEASHGRNKLGVGTMPPVRLKCGVMGVCQRTRGWVDEVWIGAPSKAF